MCCLDRSASFSGSDLVGLLAIRWPVGSVEPLGPHPATGQQPAARFSSQAAGGWEVCRAGPVALAAVLRVKVDVLVSEFSLRPGSAGLVLRCFIAEPYAIPFVPCLHLSHPISYPRYIPSPAFSRGGALHSCINRDTICWHCSLGGCAARGVNGSAAHRQDPESTPEYFTKIKRDIPFAVP